MHFLKNVLFQTINPNSPVANKTLQQEKLFRPYKGIEENIPYKKYSKNSEKTHYGRLAGYKKNNQNFNNLPCPDKQAKTPIEQEEMEPNGIVHGTKRKQQVLHIIKINKS